MRSAYTTSTLTFREMTPQKSTSAWRPSLKVADMAPLLAGAAVQMEIEGVTKAEDFDDPTTRAARTQLAVVIQSIVESALTQVAAGGAGSVELGDRPEEFFQRARTEPKDHEIKSQHEALLEYLGLDEELILSEQDMVTAAIQAAKELGLAPDYSLSNLIRDGIRRVGQELISNAVNKTNRKEGTGTSFTSPGARWEKYEEAYNKLKLEVGTASWGRRKPFITLSYIAGEARSNVIQIRRWAEATGKEIVGRPGKDDDQTAGCLIVDDKI